MGEKKARQGTFDGVLEKQLNVTVNNSTYEVMQLIRAENKLTTPELTRGLLEKACQFFERWGWFTFPALVLPVPPALRPPSPLILTGMQRPEGATPPPPVPHPELAKYSYEDLIHELLRRERLSYPLPVNQRVELNEKQGVSDLAPPDENKRRKKP